MAKQFENLRQIESRKRDSPIIVLLLADTLARLIISPSILPVGVVASFLGAPLFLYLLLKMEGAK